MTVEVRLNSAGVRQVLGSPALLRHVAGEAKAIAAAAGPGMKGDAEISTRGRAIGVVVTATRRARLNEARHRALTRAVGQRTR